jgi:predicted DNA-binding transcriptional regulator YafY
VAKQKTPAPAAVAIERHTEVIRQWQILRAIESSRFGLTIAELAARFEVTTRTIRRDLEALGMAGFPLDTVRRESSTRWILNREVFRGLIEAGLSLPELCALYFSRTLTELMAGMPFHRDLETAFEKLEDALTPKMKRYLDALSGVFGAKALPRKKPGAKQGKVVATLYKAMLEHRTVTMRYYSFHSRAERDYVVEPYRLAYANGGLYLFAFVRAYGQMRTFAVERIRSASLMEQRFDQTIRMADETFGESIGVNSGTPEPVVVRFFGDAAPHVAERVWHRTQKLEPQPDGSLIVRLHVAVDFALQAWILSFGPLAQVLSPARLAERIYEQLEEARDQYAPRLFDDVVPAPAVEHPRLPFKAGRRSATTRPS